MIGAASSMSRIILSAKRRVGAKVVALLVLLVVQSLSLLFELPHVPLYSS